MDFVIQPLEFGTDVIELNHDKKNTGCTINTVQECGCIHNTVAQCGCPST